MFGIPSQRKLMSAEPEVRPSVHIPMIYERYDPEPTHWEYYVLSIDTREAPLPTAEQLSALGRDGWLMSGLLRADTDDKSTFVHYYFVRQTKHQKH
jgi:hypothetical protein